MNKHSTFDGTSDYIGAAPTVSWPGTKYIIAFNKHLRKKDWRKLSKKYGLILALPFSDRESAFKVDQPCAARSADTK